MKRIFFIIDKPNDVKDEIVELALRHGIKLDVILPLSSCRMRTLSDDNRDVLRRKLRLARETFNDDAALMAEEVSFEADGLGSAGVAEVIVDISGIDGLLKSLKGRKRTCRFKWAVGYLTPNSRNPVYFESQIEGSIAEFPGGDWLPECFCGPLQFIFIPYGRKKQLAKMTKAEYKRFENRKKEESALLKFLNWMRARKL
ncbi:MAG: non-canonical purine NTP pyrophosphatase [Candidatus Pacebacteria bacterium]|nr:non-canonical purine NTP pyrophosphatase [Candidatus Paceibacterota bacterium]